MPTRLFAALALILLGTSCSQSDLGFSVPVVPVWNGQPISCENGAPQLTDLRFYVSDIQLIDEEGQARDVRLATEFTWQNDAVSLIDLENGSGACMNGTPDVSPELIGVISGGKYRGLRFTVGVPFRVNHLNPLMAGAPLDDPDMHWHWRSGYKFLRAGIRTETDGFWIHVGSAGCEGTVGNITGCRFPNRLIVELPDFVPGEDEVAVDLAALLAGTDLEDRVASDCSSGPPESACVAPFAALGIDFQSGKQSGTQSVFSTR